MCAITFVSVVLIRCSFSFSSFKPLASKDQQTQTRVQENDGPIIKSLAADSNGLNHTYISTSHTVDFGVGDFYMF